MILGSNYPYFSNKQTDGTVYNYHLQRPLCKDQLAKKVATGESWLKLPLFCWAAEENFVPNGYTLPLVGSSLDPQRMTNLTNLIADAQQAGFKVIMLEPGGAGQTLSPYNWTEVGDKWVRMANFITLLRASFPGIKLDLASEWIDSTAPVVLQYCRTLWSWYTAAYANGQRCEDASIAFCPTPGNVAALPSVFKGLDQSGPVNWPKRLQFHPYGMTPDWGSTYSVVDGVLKGLTAVGVPSDTEINLDESFSFQDFVTTQEINRAISDNPQWNVTVRLQWPVLPNGDLTEPVL